MYNNKLKVITCIIYLPKHHFINAFYLQLLKNNFSKTTLYLDIMTFFSAKNVEYILLS